MTAFEALDKEQKIHASLHRDVQSICNEACHFLGLDITKSAIDLVVDVLLHKIATYADDLEKFARHAKRTMINSDDCRLLTRRNSALTSRLNSLKLPSSASKDSTKRRRTVAATSSSKSSPVKKPRAAEGVENADDAIDLTFD